MRQLLPPRELAATPEVGRAEGARHPALETPGWRGAWWGRAGAVVAGSLFPGFVAITLASLFLRVPAGRFLESLQSPVVVEALRLSLVASVIATAVMVATGLPVVWFLATRTFPAKRAVETLLDLPVVLPPVVAGLALLLAFGRLGLVGRWLAPLGISLPFSTAAVVLAQVIVAGPYFVGSARAGFEAIDWRYVQAAATLRASPLYTFRRVVVPLALPSLAVGATMGWARAVGEFGATIAFAGNLPGVTQTLPLALYLALQTDLEAAVTIGVVLLVVSFTVLFATRRVLPGAAGAAAGARR